MGAEFFVWHEENIDILTQKFDDLIETGSLGALDAYRTWENFIHDEYVRHLRSLDEEDTLNGTNGI